MEPTDDPAQRALAGTLGEADSVAAAAEVVVDHLVARGLTLPSLYLEQAGRLRCIAQRGYREVIDGVPHDVGVIGRTYRTGVAVEVVDAHAEEQFLFAAPDLRCQVSVPLRLGGQVVGTLNVEGVAPFPRGTRERLEAVGAAFERRLVDLGGPPPESVEQRLARLVTAMTELDDEADIRRTTLDAGIAISGMSSAAILEPDGPDTVTVVAATGPLEDVLTGADPSELLRLDRSVTAGTSMVSCGDETSELASSTQLQGSGVSALTVVPLRASGRHLGSIVLASGSPHRFEPVVVPALEVLGAQAAASMRVARTVATLRERARQDPLTELGHHGTFHEELRARLDARLPDRHVAVLVIDVDDFKAINDRDGHQQGDHVLRELSAALSGALRDGDRLYRIGGDEFACLVDVPEPGDAADIARRMADAARGGPTTISVGVAIALDEEDADALVGRADAAMYGAKAAGRDTIGVAPARRPGARR